MRMLPVTALMICGLGGWGVFLLLPSEMGTARRRLLGIALVGFSILLATVSVPRSTSLLIAPGSLQYLLGFCLPAIAVVAAAVVSIAGRTFQHSLTGFGLLVFASSSLFIAQGALVPALANIIISAGSICTALLAISASDRSSQPTKITTKPQEAFPACLAGVMTLAAITTAIRSTILSGTSAGETGSPSATMPALPVNHGAGLVVVGILLLIAIAGLTVASENKPATAQDDSGEMGNREWKDHGHVSRTSGSE